MLQPLPITPSLSFNGHLTQQFQSPNLSLSMEQVPTTRTALVVQGRGTVEAVTGLPLPRLSDGEVLVKTASVALNPADAKMVSAGLPLHGVSGLDFAGTVVATRGRPCLGARVCGVVCGYNRERPDVGAFADYVVAEADFVLELPEGLSFEEASTLPIGILTAGLALYKTLNLPRPQQQQQHQQQPGPYALVYGASTATGTLVTQLLQRYVLGPPSPVIANDHGHPPTHILAPAPPDPASSPSPSARPTTSPSPAAAARPTVLTTTPPPAPPTSAP